MIRSVVTALCLCGLYLNATAASDPMKPPQFAPAAVEQSAVKKTSFKLQQIKMSQNGASAVINGRHKASLMIDTGASVSVLTRKFFQQQMAGSSPAFIRTEKMNTAGGEVMADVYRVNSLQLDKFMVSDIEIAVIDIDSVGGSDGLLGMNFLRHFEFAIDQKYNVLTLSSQP